MPSDVSSWPSLKRRSVNSPESLRSSFSGSFSKSGTRWSSSIGAAIAELQRIRLEALRQRLEQVRVDRRHLARDPPESAVGEHEHARRAGRGDRGGARRARDQRDLAEEVARAEAVQPPPVLRDVGGAVDDDHELAAAVALSRERLPRGDVQLVRL